MKDYSTYEEWFAKQDDATKALLTDRFTALENTVRATRQERDVLSVELKKLGDTMEDGSAAKKTVSDLQTKLQETERKAAFFEAATTAGVLRPSAAYAIATSENLFNDKGDPDFDRLRQSVPELFAARSTRHNAGSGTARMTVTNDPNNAIRKAAKSQ